MPLVLWLLLLACFPKLMTGDFCKVRIEELSVDGGGQVRTTFLIRISSGTHTRGYGNSFAWSGFPPWPTTGCELSGLGGSDLHKSSVSAEELYRHLLVAEGRTYRVVPGKPLYFYDFKSKDGVRHSCHLEVVPGSRLGF